MPVRSMATSSVMSCGSCARSAGSMALMASAVSIRLAPGCCVTLTTMAGLPLNMPRRRVSSTLSITRATSPSRTCALPREAMMRSR